jgi:hypothetical protein
MLIRPLPSGPRYESWSDLHRRWISDQREDPIREVRKAEKRGPRYWDSARRVASRMAFWCAGVLCADHHTPPPERSSGRKSTTELGSKSHLSGSCPEVSGDGLRHFSTALPRTRQLPPVSLRTISTTTLAIDRIFDVWLEVGSSEERPDPLLGGEEPAQLPWDYSRATGIVKSCRSGGSPGQRERHGPHGAPPDTPTRPTPSPTGHRRHRNRNPDRAGPGSYSGRRRDDRYRPEGARGWVSSLRARAWFSVPLGGWSGDPRASRLDRRTENTQELLETTILPTHRTSVIQVAQLAHVSDADIIEANDAEPSVTAIHAGRVDFLAFIRVNASRIRPLWLLSLLFLQSLAHRIERLHHVPP